MDFDTQVKLAIYQHIAETAIVPAVPQVAARVHAGQKQVQESYQRLYSSRVLVLEADGVTIRMAPPFSGVPTQHLVRIGEKEYFANCAWDALGIPAALHQPAEVFSRCEQTHEPIHLVVHPGGPAPEPCIIHFAVPTAHWWRNIVFT